MPMRCHPLILKCDTGSIYHQLPCLAILRQIEEMYPSFPMHEMSKSEFILNNPEWVGVLASAIFAFFTICVIIWQVIIMIVQGRRSDRRQRVQNNLIRYQIARDGVQQRNQERSEILKLASRLKFAAFSLRRNATSTDEENWESVQNTAFELDGLLKILDIATYSMPYDQWYFALEDYVEAVIQAVNGDVELHPIFKAPYNLPAPPTRIELELAFERYDPTKIILDIQAAIRMEFFDLKNMWDAEGFDTA